MSQTIPDVLSQSLTTAALIRPILAPSTATHVKCDTAVPATQRAQCAQRGYTMEVSALKPSRPELAPYCTVHRRLRATAMTVAARRPSEPVVEEPSLPPPDRDGAARLSGCLAVGDSRIVTITPALALALLERNERNRPVVQERVALYARDMSSGSWQVNNQGLALGADGELYDGQHRLWAVVRARTDVPMLVVRGSGAGGPGDDRPGAHPQRRRRAAHGRRRVSRRANGRLVPRDRDARQPTQRRGGLPRDRARTHRALRDHAALVHGPRSARAALLPRPNRRRVALRAPRRGP